MSDSSALLDGLTTSVAFPTVTSSSVTGCFVLLDLTACEVVVFVCNVFFFLLRVRGPFGFVEYNASSPLLFDAFWAFARFPVVFFFTLDALGFLVDGLLLYWLS